MSFIRNFLNISQPEIRRVRCVISITVVFLSAPMFSVHGLTQNIFTFHPVKLNLVRLGKRQVLISYRFCIRITQDTMNRRRIRDIVGDLKHCWIDWPCKGTCHLWLNRELNFWIMYYLSYVFCRKKNTVYCFFFCYNQK